MKMNVNIKKSLLVISGVIATFTLHAQQEATIERQVEVSREYAPEVRQALKLSVQPTMNDTVALRPSYDYTIYPTAWKTGFGVEAISPVQLYASDFRKQYPFYVKVGGGAPAQSIFDLYGTTTDWQNGSAGIYVNHYGQYDKRKNMLGFKERSGFMTNNVGLFGSLNVTDRLKLSGELGFEYNTWDASQMAYMLDNGNAVSDKERLDLKYSIPRVKFDLGTDFKDLTRFNYAVGADFYSLSEKEADFDETAVGFYGKVGQQFGIHKLGLQARADIVNSEVLYKLKNNIYTFTLKYGIETDLFSLDAGLDLAVDTYDDEVISSFERDNDFHVLPQAELTFKVDEAIVPFVKLSSSLVKNNLYSYVRRNPFAYSPVSIENGRSYDLRAGAYGAISPSFGYRIYAGGGIEYDIPYDLFFKASTSGLSPDEYVLLLNCTNLEPYSRINYFTLGGELEARLGGSFTGILEAQYHKYSAKSDAIFDGEKKSYVYGRPDYTVALKGEYNHKNKLFVRAGAKLIGDMKIGYVEMASGFQDIKVKTAVDLSLEAEYFFKPNFGAFVSGSNLLGEDLYYFGNYKDDKMRVNAGVKFLF